jgi:hypothetical protein
VDIVETALGKRDNARALIEAAINVAFYCILSAVFLGWGLLKPYRLLKGYPTLIVFATAKYTRTKNEKKSKLVS